MKADNTQFIRTIELKDRSGRVIGTKEVVTYQGLLSKAHDEGLKRVSTTLLQIPVDDNGRTAIAKAEVETEKGSFEALGDASPESVTSFLTPHLIRMAETRAKARALRDAVNVGVVSFEELDGEDLPGEGHSDLGPGASQPDGHARGQNGSDTTPSRSPMRRGRGLAAPASQQGFQPMTESQRRFLFRILSGQGLKGDAAEERVHELLGVASLSDVSKEMASSLIDELQTRPRGNGLNVPGAPLQR
jgi:hypothetical protein